MKNGHDIGRLALIAVHRPELLTHDEIRQLGSALTNKNTKPSQQTEKRAVTLAGNTSVKAPAKRRRRGKGWRGSIDKIQQANA